MLVFCFLLDGETAAARYHGFSGVVLSRKELG
jgi:hypothetical protein